jgi:hypothetical protein
MSISIYAQPYEGERVVGPRMPTDGPVVERDPTFTRLRARFPDPSRLLEMSLYELRDELLIWGDMRIDGRDLFGNWSGDDALPGYPVGLVPFALALGWLIRDALANGSTDYDPTEGGAALLVRPDGDQLAIYSVDVNERFTVSLGEAWNAVYGISGRVRAFLLSLDHRFADHPELGPWVRGEVLLP